MLTIDGFQPLLADFYREARLDRPLDCRRTRSPAHDRQFPHRDAAYRHVMDAYLREVEKPSNGRTFTVYVEPLVGARTNFRNQGDAYSIVVGSVTDSSVDTIQHAYLHFMLDRFVLRYRPLVDTKRALLPWPPARRSCR